ncbi:MAG: hypothetical protein H7122_19015 [Chitinophagaceae bacterium]|nr:hypothetical protein [Chitinophagaceae bacterium]
MSGKSNILIAALLVVAAGSIYIYKEYNRTNINVAGEPSAFNISAIALIQVFTDNDSAASRKFVGKIISVTGLIKNLDKDERGFYTVSLGDSSSLSSVRCSVDSTYTANAALVKPGMTIKIKGNCTGYNKDELLGLDVIVNRCIIETN